MAGRATVPPNRIAICGNSLSGKTSLFRCIQSQPFDSSPSPTQIATHAIFIDPESSTELNLWDTGSNPTQSILPIQIYARRVDVVLVTTESLNPKSVEAVNSWIQKVRLINVGELTPTFAIIRTKADDGLAEEQDTIQRVAGLFECEVFVVSAKTGHGVEQLQRRLIEMCDDRRAHPPQLIEAGEPQRCHC
jgi:GTPase SAR1 family protein